MAADELRALQERVAQVDQIADMPGWEMLIDRARQTIFAKRQRIVQGKCVDHTDYMRECAYLDGINFVLTLPRRIQLELDRYIEGIPIEVDEEPIEMNDFHDE